MIPRGRIVRLAIQLSWASKLRFVLLTLIAAVAMVVFLVVTELSRLSSEDLKQSISAEAGKTGTYAVDFSSTLGLSPNALRTLVTGVLEPFAPTSSLTMVEILSDVSFDCPPEATLGTQPALIVLHKGLNETRGSISAGTNVCLGGQRVPPAAITVPTDAERLEWLGEGPGSSSSGLVVDDMYQRLVLLSDPNPPNYRFIFVTGRDRDQTFEIEKSLSVRFQTLMKSFGIPATEVPFNVTRIDSAPEIRRAATGVDLVYSLVAWGVLILGALGLLVAEMIVVRDRSWFYGLSRAVGARALEIGSLVLVDILFVLGVGTILTLILAAALQPIAASFVDRTFQIQGVALLRASTFPKLMLGEGLILILAGCYPALRAVRQDPVDVLEPRVL